MNLYSGYRRILWIMKKIAGGKLKDFSFVLCSISIPLVLTKMRPI